MAVVVLWSTIVATMVVFERSLIFFPEPYPSGDWDVEAVGRRTGTVVRDEFFTAEDGVRLHGWWCEAADPVLRGRPPGGMVVLWFHGNAGNLAHRAELMAAFARLLPVRVFLVDYRGYGRSEGRPTERGLYADARAAWSHLRDRLDVPADRIVILGKSLGGAVAIELATEVESAGLIVESSFTSVPAMAAHHYPVVPRWLVRTKMASIDKIGDVRAPLMVVHSPDDGVVPFEQGRELYETAGGDKRFVEIPGGGHNELWIVGGERYFSAVREFLLHCGNLGTAGP